MATTALQAYDELIRRSREASLLGSCAALLDWDHQTYMPPKGSGHRAEQLSLLAGMVHRLRTAPEIQDLLAAVEASPMVREAGTPAAVNVRELRWEYDRAVRVPEELVKELTRVCALAHDIWVEARQNSDFSRFAPWLTQIVGLKRQEADALGYRETPYDALLEEYEPGETTAGLRPVLERLRDGLIPLVQAIAASDRQPDRSVLAREYPVGAQREFGRRVAAATGFDFQAGRLDVTAHPFCSGIGPGDTRLTTRYNERDFGDGFFSILHETGHGLYDQGLDSTCYGTPMGSAVSLGIHESQSRLWENLVGRSRSFWEHFFPQAREAFPSALGDVLLDDFVFAVNDVRPSLIRTEADEATYNLHILLRFELEQALLTGDLRAADVPAAWAERMQSYLGLTPPDDARGCLQDVHWSGGGFGYFPTYTLGNLYAAQFFAQAEAELEDLPAQLRRGDLHPLHAWLADRIYRQGMRYRARTLVVVVTGQPLSPQPLLDHLSRKYRALYGI